MTLSIQQRNRISVCADELASLAQEAFNPVDTEALEELSELVRGLSDDFGGQIPGCLVILASIRRKDRSGT